MKASYSFSTPPADQPCLGRRYINYINVAQGGSVILSQTTGDALQKTMQVPLASQGWTVEPFAVSLRVDQRVSWKQI